MSSFSILSNISATKAQRQIERASNQLGDSLNRLSSGMRINKSADDAAGLAIASTLNAQTRVFNQGVRNLNDGLSLLNVAGGALGQLSEINQRLRELATQAANGSYSSVQRASLDTEARTLVSEFNRVLGGTKYNGRNILGGNFGYLSIQAGYGNDGQVGYNIGQSLERQAGSGSFSTSVLGVASSTVDMVVADINGDSIKDLVYTGYPGNVHLYARLGNGDGTFGSESDMIPGSGTPSGLISGDFNGDGYDDVAFGLSDGTLQIMRSNGDGTFTNVGSYSAVGILSLATADFNGDGDLDIITADSNGDIKYYRGMTDSSFASAVTIGNVSNASALGIGDVNGDGRNDIIVTGTNKIGTILSTGSGTFGQVNTLALSGSPFRMAVGDFDMDGKADVLASGAGVAYFLSGSGSGTLSLRSTFGVSGFYIEAGDFNNDGLLDFMTERILRFGNGNGSFGQVITHSSGLTRFTAADFNGDGILDFGASGSSIVARLGVSQNTTQMSYFSIRSRESALSAIDTIQAMQDRISAEIGNLGAYQSRFETAKEELKNRALNYEAAKGRISDADVAHESAEAVRKSILLESGSAVLAQAQTIPTLILDLLKDAGI